MTGLLGGDARGGLLAANDPPLDGLLGAVAQQYPALAPHLGNFIVQWGPAQADARQLEFYPPWERDNPNPGKTTLELYNRDLNGAALQNAVAGDALHLLGAVDPRTGEPVDQRYYAMKQQLLGSLTPQQQSIDRRAYERERAFGDPGPYDDWMQRSRLDAYIRGRLTPDANDAWGRAYNTQQLNLLEGMRNYLKAPR
jgi:hypothetical protein